MDTPKSVPNDTNQNGTTVGAAGQWAYDGTRMTKEPLETTVTDQSEDSLGPPLAMWLALCVNYKDQYGNGPGWCDEDRQRLADACGITLEAANSFFAYAQDNFALFSAIGREFKKIMNYRYPVGGCPNTPNKLLAMGRAAIAAKAGGSPAC